MRLFRKLTKKEWAEIGEKYKDGGVHIYRGKKTLFYKGEKLWDSSNESKDWLIYSRKERLSWEVIIVLPGVEVIPRDTFPECKNVKIVIMADTVKRIERDAFHYCFSLRFVQLSRNFEFVGISAFQKCTSLISIFIPSSCREICECAFFGCHGLIILSVPQHTQLGDFVVADTY